ncbi:MAG: DEAD/DEAH box helicase [Candidatus Thalassarchaeaceae archaeon]|tara:strand:+ start:221 stop:1486 length:1266 start_codon:yes stop_codon:yes gene_type:complete
MTNFESLGLCNDILKAIKNEGYHRPTPVQELAIPLLIGGRDVLGVAQTGTGKTAAFALPVLEKLSFSKSPGKRNIRALILSPTRELAAQIDQRFYVYSKYVDIRHMVIFGGVGQKPQVQSLRKGIDVLVATPGRLLDLIQQGYVNLDYVEFFVLDEADRMLDMGFIRDIKKILKILPKNRQNLLFSATMPSKIADLANSFLNNAEMVDLSPKEITVERIDQAILFVRKEDKIKLIIDIIKDNQVERGIIFTRTKHGANRLVKKLDRANISALAIHGNKSQGARTRALSQFKNGSTPLLVATDIASRGIDVDDVSHVFNYDLPNEPESYVHRIGRTARAGKGGTAYAFCDDSESGYLVGIERLIGKKITVIDDHPYHFTKAIPKPNQKPGKIKNSKNSSNSGNNKNARHRTRRRRRRKNNSP